MVLALLLTACLRRLNMRVVYTDACVQRIWRYARIFTGSGALSSIRSFSSLFFGREDSRMAGQVFVIMVKKNLSEKFSSVYAFVYSPECMKYAHWIAKKCKLPLVVHLADHSPEFERSILCRILRGASKLVCITEEMKSKYERTLGRKDIEVLHNGAEQACSEIASPPSEPFSEQNPFVLCFIGGLFSHLHGDCIEDIFEAVSQIRQKFPWIEFHLYGQRQPADFLEDLIRRDGFTHHGIVMPLRRSLRSWKKLIALSYPLPSRRRNTGTIATPFPPNCLNSLPPVARSYLTAPRKLRQIESLKPTTWAYASMTDRYQSW